jgi:hypothetical protein
LKRSILESSDAQTKITNKANFIKKSLQNKPVGFEEVCENENKRKFDPSKGTASLQRTQDTKKLKIHLKMNNLEQVFTHIQHFRVNVVDKSCGFHYFAKQTTCDWPTCCETPPLDGVVRSGSIS